MEHKTRGHHAEDAWHALQAEGWRLAAEDTVMTETERERSEHRTIWTKVVGTKSVSCASAGVTVALSQTVEGVISCHGDTPKKRRYEEAE